jgi:menaquinone-dependent protoporphyrinogen oxidase
VPRILIIHCSNHGHTSKIAARIGAAIERTGIAVELCALSDGGDPAPGDYDAVIAGASIHAGKHQHELVDWATRHRSALAQLPTAFFSVCLTAADHTEESRVATRGYIDDFVEATGWTPAHVTTFAGALQYREYDFVTRLMMRLMMHRMDHPSDVSRDYDYTDWEAVDRWALEFAGTLVPAPAGP